MTKILRKYLGLLAALPFLLVPTISGAFELPTFAAGIGLTGASVHTKGTETDPEGTVQTKKIYDSSAVEYASIFGEVRFNIVDRLGLTVGVSTIPGSAQFVTESKPDSDLTTSSGGTNTGTSTVTGKIKSYVSVYIQPTIRITDVFSVYLSAGRSRMDVEAKAALVTSTDFTKTANSPGTHFGAGVMAQHDSGFFMKLEGTASDYDSVTFTTADSTQAKADIDGESVSLLLGKAF
jgi:hypothetical protein